MNSEPPDVQAGLLEKTEEPDILEYEVKWSLGNNTTNKVSGGNGITAELFQILKDNAIKVLHSLCQQTCKIKQ